jgi:hypothetical protein
MAVGACVDQSPTDVNDDVGFTDESRLAANGITPPMLLNAIVTSGRLYSTNLAGLVSTDDSRKAAAYLVGCALVPGHNITTTYPDGAGGSIPITIPGALGVADSWTTTALTTNQQQLLSACIFARMNANGVSVTISLRGPSNALSLVGTEGALYALQEGAFFGNFFLPSGSGFLMGSCTGTGTVPGSANRQCAQTDSATTCGVTYGGMCADICTWDDTAGYFTSCTVGGTSYQPIATYLH